MEREVSGPVPASREVLEAPIPTHMSPEETAALVDLARGRYVLEVGSWLGHSTVEMARVAERVWAVDWHRSDPHLEWATGGCVDSARQFLDNLDRAGVRDRVVAVIGRSEEVLPRLAGGRFDLVFLDGYHSEEQTETDARNALSVLGPVPGRNQVIAAHDYGLFGVTEGLRRAGLGAPDRTAGYLAIFQL